MTKILKRIGIVLVVLVGLLVIIAGVLYVVGGSKVNATVEIPGENLTVTMDSAAVDQGRYVAMTHGCMDCHGANLEGRVFVDAPPFFVVASNLTPAGVGNQYGDADWERAIRHGVRPNGHGLAPMMPAAAYTHLADDETASLMAYLKSLPPVENDLPATEIRPLGRIIAATGGFYMANAAIDQTQPHRATAPPAGPTVEYGQYRAEVICTYCHGADLHGGPPIDPGAPPATDLYVVTGWTLDQFVQTMRTGVTPNGKELNPEFMPWAAFKHMTDDELEALYNYLSTLSPAEAQTASS